MERNRRKKNEILGEAKVLERWKMDFQPSGWAPDSKFRSELLKTRRWGFSTMLNNIKAKSDRKTKIRARWSKIRGWGYSFGTQCILEWCSQKSLYRKILENFPKYFANWSFFIFEISILHRRSLKPMQTQDLQFFTDKKGPETVQNSHFFYFPCMF